MNRFSLKSSGGSTSTGSRARQAAGETAHQGTRETIESVVIAVILAFLFRAFEAEAFVIPTGSMAPTLQGQHTDVECEQCGYRYQTGASVENPDADQPGTITSTTCPICRYPMLLQRYTSVYYGQWQRLVDTVERFGGAVDRSEIEHVQRPLFDVLDRNADGKLEQSELDESLEKLRWDLNHESFTGDRILVNKFAYQIGEPDRWDVIVFKYPGNAKQNYIKRLVGKPNETILIRHGDIYIQDDEGDFTFPLDDSSFRTAQFKIARKPPHKVKAMLQLVDDTEHIADGLTKVGWPARWQEWSVAQDDRSWKMELDGRSQIFQTDGKASDIAWLRYRHLVPHEEDWLDIRSGLVPARMSQMQGELISDHYAYNDTIPGIAPYERETWASLTKLARRGLHWVGDLGVQCEVDITSADGFIYLDLVEGGVHYTCQLDVASGVARLSIDGGERTFTNGKTECEAQTELRGPGTYQLRFANVDNQLHLWINEHVVSFDDSPVYTPAANVQPKWSVNDPGDAEPVGIGSQGAGLRVRHLRVLRDVYYIATKAHNSPEDTDYGRSYSSEEIRAILEDPQRWNNSPLFPMRKHFSFPLGPDQFFPLGDNSPQSSDARYWKGKGIDPFVDRELLTGKALFVYWPHPWNRPLPFVPNFRRMRFIR